MMRTLDTKSSIDRPGLGFARIVALTLALLLTFFAPCISPSLSESADSSAAEVEFGDEEICECISRESTHHDKKNRGRSPGHLAAISKAPRNISQRHQVTNQHAGKHRLATGLLAPLRC